MKSRERSRRSRSRLVQLHRPVHGGRRRALGAAVMPAVRDRAGGEGLPPRRTILARCRGRPLGLERRPRDARPTGRRVERGGPLPVPSFVAGGLDPDERRRRHPAPAARRRRRRLGRRERSRHQGPSAGCERFFEAVREADVPEPVDARGYFGEYGGRFAPETLMAPLEELERGVRDAGGGTARFRAELDELLRNYAGRPTPLTFADRLSERLRRRADRARSARTSSTPGAHKLNNALGQVLLARRMGKTRVVAETGAGQHGVATAAAAAKLGVACRVYMGVDRHGAPGAERLADAAARRRGRRRGRRLEDAEGRDQRGDAGLDRERRHDALRPGLGARARIRIRRSSASSSP